MINNTEKLKINSRYNSHFDNCLHVKFYFKKLNLHNYTFLYRLLKENILLI